MDDNKFQKNINLIAHLLSCSNNDEINQVLNNDWELVDSELVQTMLQVAVNLAETGEIDNANFLIQVAHQLKAILELPEPNGEINFLMEVLKVIEKTSSGQRKQVVYPLLAINLDKLDDNFNRLLREWAPEMLRNVQLEEARNKASSINSFSNLIQQFPLGNRAINLEIAITGYEVALSVFTRNTDSVSWALIQNNLGSAYSERLKGDKAENLENAIAAYRLALDVRTREDFPEQWARTQYYLGIAYYNLLKDNRSQNLQQAIAAYESALNVYTRKQFPDEWAETQNNLASAYFYRIEGEKGKNIERALQAYESALNVYTREQFPEKWATIQNNLASAYLYRIEGEKSKNIERAIQVYQLVLDVRTREDFPEQWATTQNNIGIAYYNRIEGDKAENIEQAIAAYRAALNVYTREQFPEKWARSQNNLGIAYSDRVEGNKTDNLELAIAAYEAALNIYTCESFPQQWATIQNNLGAAYSDRVEGNKTENLERALAAYESALNVYTRENFPEDWARIQNNVGNDYAERLKGIKAENQERAIAAYESALNIYTRENFPEDWARTQNNLGNVYYNRQEGAKAQNIDKAIAAYELALQVRISEAFPQEYAQTQFNLGLAYQKAELFSAAKKAFAGAIKTVEFLRSTIRSGDEIKQKLAEEWNELYQVMVEVCIDLYDYNAAIEYVERSKARNLVELLSTRKFDPKGDIAEAVRNQLNHLRQRIDAEQRRQQILQRNRSSNGGIISGESSQQLISLQPAIPERTNLNQLWQQLDDLIEREITPIDPKFGLTQKVEPISYSQIQCLTGENTAIVEWYITGDKFLTFIITPQSPTPILWKSSKQDLEDLMKWSNEYLDAYYYYYQEKKIHWKEELAFRLQRLAQILHIDDLLSHIPPTCDHLILIPHRYLHLFPLHVLEAKKQEAPGERQCFNCSCKTLLDLFPGGVRYAPSCQLLQQTSERQRLNFSHLFAIQNPTQDLEYADLEVQAIAQYFPFKDILVTANANKSAIDKQCLRIAHCAHFSCHGYFNFNEPLLSALLLADCEVSSLPANPDPNKYFLLQENKIFDLSKCITLADLFTLDLSQCRLVTLSACETGLTDFRPLSDEYIGLPSGFLYAGTSSVVSSLWTVNDISTALLMIRFYQNLRQGTSVALALNQAQLWLRDLTKVELQKWISENQIQLDATLSISLRRRLNKDIDNDKPFQSPFHWAAFCVLGQ
ncbi:tetratricopeptide repeat protein [Scytonema sp. UIC 10036]|uniref:CHAT domain-containing protein n=1 Tax=Scytonema sp. UIC 10036 TaxID=2304196 RepID=UPI0012DA73FD|nr:CHAT domain-containing protein [Scytonema sp. UIC 10036]MUG94181.1 tetratricopeptide repeat protein [Scytonema sp. UIC 10036]